MTSKELVLSTLEFRNKTGRVPRQLWSLPWAEIHAPEMLQKLRTEWKWDIVSAPVLYHEIPHTEGSGTEPGRYVDEWGCTFENLQRGVIGEVKHPLVQSEDWSDADRVHIPEEFMSFDIDEVNAQLAADPDPFYMIPVSPRPFERLQFIRGTVDLYVDLMDPPEAMMSFLHKMHDFYCRLLTKWAQTDVDALFIMDDWGSQRDLLINPQIWEEIFMPMYRDYINIAHSHGKKIFMHSDGNTLRILPKLIELGLDAINTQLFCMDFDELAKFRGKITFWGEIDRQNLIPNASLEEIDAAVQKVYDHLWQDGGCIAQCEFGPAGNPDNVLRIFEKWNSLR